MSLITQFGQLSQLRPLFSRKSPDLFTGRNTEDARRFRENPHSDSGRLRLGRIEHDEKAGCFMFYTRLSILLMSVKLFTLLWNVPYFLKKKKSFYLPDFITLLKIKNLCLTGGI